MNKTCQKKKKNINIMSISCSGKINKTRYDDPRKPIKQTSFTVKNLGGKPFQKAIHYSKEKF